MNEGIKKTFIIALGVAGGLLIAGAIGFIAKIFVFSAVVTSASAEFSSIANDALARESEIRDRQKNLKKLKARNEAIAKKENSNECRFWRQQLDINKNAARNIYKYCHYGPNHKEAPHPNADKIWKSSSD